MGFLLVKLQLGEKHVINPHFFGLIETAHGREGVERNYGFMADEFIFDAEEGHYAPRGRPSVAPAPELKGVSPAPSPLSDISAFHKVLSACVGSLITCLVGTGLTVKSMAKKQALTSMTKSDAARPCQNKASITNPPRVAGKPLYQARLCAHPSIA